MCGSANDSNHIVNCFVQNKLFLCVVKVSVIPKTSGEQLPGGMEYSFEFILT